MVSELDADLDRYRALLKDADDEPKRLALIQLLIDEGAARRFAERSKTAKTKPPWLQPPAFETPVSNQPALSLREAEPPTEIRSDPELGDLPVREIRETEIPPAADAIKLANLSTRLQAQAPDRLAEPLLAEALPNEPSAVADKMATAATILPDLSEPSFTDDVVDGIAELPGGPESLPTVAHAPTIASPSAVPASGDDIENSIILEIQAALGTRLETPTPEPHPSDPEPYEPSGARAKMETAGATLPVLAEPSRSRGLVGRIAALLGHVSQAKGGRAATMASSSTFPSSDNELENQIISEIEAALAKGQRQ